MKKELTKSEVTRLNALLHLEEQPLRDVYHRLNGGFVRTEVFDYDNEYVDVELIWGKQAGGDDDVTHSETLKINRKTMTWAC
jgi:hypothetical protein